MKNDNIYKMYTSYFSYMNGGLVALVHTGAMNVYYPNKYSLVTDKLKGETNVPLIIPRRADMVRFDGVIIQCCDIPNIKALRIVIGGNVIWNNPFKLLMKLSTVTEN